MQISSELLLPVLLGWLYDCGLFSNPDLEEITISWTGMASIYAYNQQVQSL